MRAREASIAVQNGAADRVARRPRHGILFRYFLRNDMVWNRFSLSVLVVSLALLSACGGRQGVRDASIEWQSAVQAVPADAAFAFVMDPDEREAEQLRSSFQSLVDGSGEMGTMGPSIAFLPFLGIFEEIAPFLLEHIDLEGDGAIFVRDGALWLMATSNDPAAARNEIASNFSDDEAFSEREVAGNPGFRMAKDELSLDVTESRNYLVMRFGPERDVRETDREFVALFDGSFEAGTLMTTERGLALEQRLDVQAGEDIASLLYFDVASIDALAEQYLGEGGVPFAPPPADEEEGGVSDEVCRDARDRIVASFPWGGAISSRDEAGAQRSAGFSALSARAVERARRVLPGAPQGLADLGVANGLFGVGVNVDFGAFFETQAYPPELAQCRNVAMVAGLLATLNESMGHRIRFGSRTLSGAFGLYVQAVNLQGFVPTLDGAIVIGSPNPNALSSRLQRQLNDLGEPTVVPEASRTTIIYQLQVPPMQLQLVELEDRLVLSVGDVDPAVIQTLYSASLGEAGEPWMVVGANGRRLASMFRELGQYLDEMMAGEDTAGLGGPPPGDSARSAADAVERFGQIISRSRVSDEGLESSGTTDSSGQ